MPLRVIFAGTPAFAAVALAAIHAAGHTVPMVLTQPDRPGGRGLKLQASAVKQYAQLQGIPVCQPRSLRLDGKYPEDARCAQQALETARADIMVVAAYGLILPQWLLDIMGSAAHAVASAGAEFFDGPPQEKLAPSGGSAAHAVASVGARLGCFTIHASLLPRWRGAAPIHRAIEAGDAYTGITIMQMDAGLDTGAMLRMDRLAIAPDDTTGSLHDRLAVLGGQAIVLALADALADRKSVV